MTTTATAVARARPAPGGRDGGRPGRAAGRWAALGRAAQVRLWPTAVLLGALSLLATATSRAGEYVGDNRFEQFWAPAWRAARELSLWDGTRGLGRVAEELWPATAVVAVLRGLGASPALAERLFHAGCLTVAGLGAVALVRVFAPRIGPGHVLAGVLYACNPYSATFLVPSVLFWNYAIAPWFLVAFLAGVRGDRPWRAAAAFALLAFSAGTADVPGTAYALVPVPAAAVWVVHVERSARWRHVGGWAARAAALTALTCAAAAVKVVAGGEALRQRLQSTETAEAVATTSSWSESWRGLGFWRSYLPAAASTARLEGGAHLYESWAGVVVTFVAPAVAVAALWRLRWRPRLLLAAGAVPALALMVGAHPPDHPSPLGSALLAVQRVSPSLAAFRTGYKAGAGLLLFVAVLAGAGVMAAARWLRPGLRPVLGALAVALVALAALPFWNGGLYPRGTSMQDVPAHWREALAWLDGRPGDGRVLVLPGATRAAYRWGWPGDDVLDAGLRRHPPVAASAFPLAGERAAGVVDALDAAARDGSLRPGMLAPVARRLGIAWVLVRNDLDWERTGTARPAALAPVRSDPDLTAVATFGRPGDGVVAAGDDSPAAAVERNLPPIEVYRVHGVGGQALARPAGPGVLVAGDGSAWPDLAAAGDLDAGGPVRFTADLGAADLAAALDGGARLVVTDTNRRRQVEVRGPAPSASGLLAPGQDGDDGFGSAPAAQSTAWFPDATVVEASGTGTPVDGLDPWYRPANAFDRNPATAWLTAGLEDATGSWVRVRFRAPLDLDRVTVVPYRPATGRRVDELSLRFSDGSVVDVALGEEERVEVPFPPRTSAWLEVRVEATTGGTEAAVGLRDVEVPGLDLTEVVQVPDDPFVAADGDPRLAAVLADAAVAYRFRRATGTGPQDEEAVLRRRFRTAGERAWAVAGTLRMGATAPDRLVDQLAGGPVGAWGTVRVGSPAAGRGGLAVDGDPATSWAAPPEAGAALHVRLPAGTPVAGVRVVARGAGSSRVTGVMVAAGGRQVDVAMSPVPGCGGTDCPTAGSAPLAVPGAAEVVVTVTAVEVVEAGGRPAPVRIAEVDLGLGDAPADPGAGTGEAACVEGVVAVDGRPVPVRLAGATAGDDLVAGRPVAVEGCAPLALDAGWHRLAGTAGSALVSAALAAGEAAADAEAGGPVPAATVVRRSPTEVVVAVDGRPGDLVLTGQSWDPGWRAEAGGVDLGRPLAVDTQSAWVLPDGIDGPVEVRMTYGPQRTFEWALAATLAGLVLCVALLARRPQGGGGGGR